MKTNVLVTGGGGFAGRNLTEYLGANPAYEVFSPSSKELNLLDDSGVKDFFSARRVDVVVHCANRGGARRTGYDEGKSDVVSDNLRMFFNLARAMPKTTRMLHMGTGAEYDRRNYAPKMKEIYFDSFVPADAYAYSKYVISKYIERAENMVCLRIFGLYGKYEDYTYKFISNAIVKNLLGLPIIISQNVRFDYLYISDFCRIVERFMREGGGDTHYNVTPTRSVHLVELAEDINKVSGRPVEIRVLKAGMNTEYTGDNSRLLKRFPDLSFTAYEAAVAELYHHYSSALPSLDTETIRKDPYLKACITKDAK